MKIIRAITKPIKAIGDTLTRFVGTSIINQVGIFFSILLSLSILKHILGFAVMIFPNPYLVNILEMITKYTII